MKKHVQKQGNSTLTHDPVDKNTLIADLAVSCNALWFNMGIPHCEPSHSNKGQTENQI